MLSKFQADGFSIGLITARSWHPRARGETIKTFAAQGVFPDELLVVSYNESKADILRDRRENIISVLEDNGENAKQCQAAGLPTTLITRPWNADVVNVPRIVTLDEYDSVVTSRSTASQLQTFVIATNA
jgi:hypothetical protein